MPAHSAAVEDCFSFGHHGVSHLLFYGVISRRAKLVRAFSDEVDAGSSKKMRPNKKLERDHLSAAPDAIAAKLFTDPQSDRRSTKFGSQ